MKAIRISLSFLALGVPAPVLAAPACAAFVDVNVVSTDRPEVTPDETVVIIGRKIVSVGRKASVSSRCAKIDGHDRYLIPGLADTHVHVFGYSRGGEGDRRSETAIMHMLLANGVTTAVLMEGSPATLRLRKAVAVGEIVGPTLYTAGPLIQAPNTGAPPHRRTFETPDDVRREVEQEKSLGYDFVKVHGGMPKETYAELLATARRVGLPVIGHVPDNLGIDAALDGGQVMIAHAESYLQTYFEFHRELPTDPAEIDRMARDVARRTASAGVYVQPTLSVFRQIITEVGNPESLLDRPEMRLMPPVSVSDWLPDRNPYLHHWTVANLAHFRDEYRVMQHLVRALRDAGVPLLVGSDDMVPMQLPGFSMHNEMVQLQEAGLTPFEVLQAATLRPAQFLHRVNRSGRVARGYDADLVLLAANPLETTDNDFRQDGVMLRGRWFSEARLQDMLWSANVRAQKTDFH
jgi:imidazolonepropionase-like amidohydrolase